MGPKVVDNARRAQARNACLNLETSIKGYFTEYGRYPVPQGGREEWKTTSEIMDVLTYNTASPSVQDLNPRGIIVLAGGCDVTGTVLFVSRRLRFEENNPTGIQVLNRRARRVVSQHIHDLTRRFPLFPATLGHR
ncbi:MAG: hypothetical protein AAF514_07750, partial [Verrucomicrobiota bacterium]